MRKRWRFRKWLFVAMGVVALVAATSWTYAASAFSLAYVATESEGHSYLDLVQVIETGGTSTQIVRDLEQLFRRVLFNILVGNRDDHLR